MSRCSSQSGTVRLEGLTPGLLTRAVEYLARSPYEHVLLTYIALQGGAMRRDLHVALDEHDRVCGVAFLGRQTILASERQALAAFAALGMHSSERAIVGPRATVEAYWDLIRAWHAPPRLVRNRQPLLALEPSSLIPCGDTISVRRAREDEWEAIAENSAAMIAGELESEPERATGEFGLGIRRMIRFGLWWVGESDGELCFFCDVGAWSAQTAQLQGIWTPPRFRHRGIATSALGAICATLLRTVPTLSLYVNDFNVPALALYHRLGFREVGELQTIFF